MSFSRERQRLERAFHAILLALSAPVASLGCTSRPPATRDAGMDQGAPPPVEAGLDGCTATEYQIEAGHDAADAQDTCGFIFSCGLRGTGLIHQGCTVLLANDGAPMPVPGETCLLAPDAGCEHDALAPGPGGALTVLCTPCPGGIGRRPVGLQGGAVTRGQGVGAYLARMAFEESAAVTAFERMHEELVALGAPRVLVRAAKQAAQDERRHARVVSRLAKARGGSLERIRIRPPRPRSLVAIALENAAEGCVRETYGALLARYQASRAKDTELREAFSAIGEDETRHAALSWAVATWLDSQLTVAEQRRVAGARRRALSALERDVAQDPPDALLGPLGLPRGAVARALVRKMGFTLGLRAGRRDVVSSPALARFPS